jgi:hypothetical protein
MLREPIPQESNMEARPRVRYSPTNPAPEAIRCTGCKWRQDRQHLPRVGRKELCKTCYERTLSGLDPAFTARLAERAKEEAKRQRGNQKRPRRQAITTDTILVDIHYDADTPGVEAGLLKHQVVWVFTILRGEDPIIELKDYGRCVVPKDSIQLLG